MNKAIAGNKANSRQRFLDWQAFAFAALFVLVAQPAQAGLDWGTMICNFTQQNSGWNAFANWIAYITGTYFAARAIFLARYHTEDPARYPISKVLLHAFTGAALLVFPSFTRMILNSVYVAVPVGGALACTPGTVTAVPGPTVGLDVLARNFVENIRDPFFFMAGWFCFCLGIWFMYRGLNKMSKYNTDPKAYSVQSIVANFFVGAMLMYIGQSKNIFMSSLFGAVYGTCGGLLTAGGGLAGGVAHNACGGGAGVGLINWAALGFTGPTTQFDQAYIAATMFFQIIGFIAFIRGWLLAKAHVEGVGNATMGQALTHIIGGAICMNIIVFLRAAQATFGVNFFT